MKWENKETIKNLWIDAWEEEISRYPSQKLYDEVVEKLCKFYDIPQEYSLSAILTAGADSGISTINRIFSPKKIGVISPYFKYYTLLSSPFTKVKKVAFYDFDQHCWKIREEKKDVDVIFINIPHSPVSYLPSWKEIKEMLSFKATIYVFDLAGFFWLPTNYRKKILRNLLFEALEKNIIMIFSTSKDLFTPGLRIGLLWISPNIFNIVKKYSEPYPVSTISAKKILSIFNPDIKSTVRKIEEIQKKIHTKKYQLCLALKGKNYKILSGCLPHILVEGNLENLSKLWLCLNQNNIILPLDSEFNDLPNYCIRIPLPSEKISEKIMEVVNKCV